MSATTMTDRAAAPRYNRNVVDAFRAASSRRNGGDAGVPPPDFDGGSGGDCDHNCDSAHLAITQHGVHAYFAVEICGGCQAERVTVVFPDEIISDGSPLQDVYYSEYAHGLMDNPRAYAGALEYSLRSIVDNAARVAEPDENVSISARGGAFLNAAAAWGRAAPDDAAPPPPHATAVTACDHVCDSEHDAIVEHDEAYFVVETCYGCGAQRVAVTLPDEIAGPDSALEDAYYSEYVPNLADSPEAYAAALEFVLQDLVDTAARAIDFSAETC